MSSLREVKDRIASVRSTLKITSAMKLVASSKLRKAQRAAESLRPYEETLSEILAAAGGSTSREVAPLGHGRPRSSEATSASVAPLAEEVKEEHSSDTGEFEGVRPLIDSRRQAPLAVLAFSSNSSMCGAFNANVIKKTLELVRAYESRGVEVEVWAFGRKMAEALRKAGRPAARDYSAVVAHSSFESVAAVAEELLALHMAGKFAGAVLVYNHFVSTGRQQVVVEPYLAPSAGSMAMASDAFAGIEEPTTFVLASLRPSNVGPSSRSSAVLPAPGGEPVILSERIESRNPQSSDSFIIEPSRAELVAALLPQILNLRLYAAVLDSAASEHAARMIAMQTATDNAEQLLGELTLEYNKGRQQKITSEILDLVGAEA